MKFTVQQIAETLGGVIEGNPEISVNTLSKIEEGTEGSLSFLANKLYTPYIYTTLASAVIVNKDFVAEQPIKTTLIRVEDAYSAFAKLLEFYNQVKLNKTGISQLAFISLYAEIGENNYIGEFAFIGENVKLGKNVKIYPQVYVGDNSVIGDNTTIFPGAKLYSDTIIGKNCIIHAGVVLGADGFGFAPQADNVYNKVAQIGNVIIEDNVEIGANTSIDRATLGSTIIKKGVKLDNQIQIGHNVVVGENTVIVSQTGIAGSTKIGKNCMIAGQVGIVGHISIADNVKIGAQSGINTSVKKEGAALLGSPAHDVGEYRKTLVHFRNLSKLVARIEELERKLKEKE
ncbi:MAG: UDP-3-O-(3-hydroxymyristoyl)glucosamine N-acyltransferase [Bacteroidetes bacterium]|nr:UDP-3-O-(3-hydroxymyristoyl)glucosamine N-acyltransferase [Bacteroidota bacterium]